MGLCAWGERSSTSVSRGGLRQGCHAGHLRAGNLSNGFLTLFMARSLLSLSSQYKFFEAPRMEHVRDSVKVKKTEEGRVRKTDGDAEKGRVWEVSVKGSRQETVILTLKVWDINFSCLDERRSMCLCMLSSKSQKAQLCVIIHPFWCSQYLKIYSEANSNLVTGLIINK